MTRGSYSNDKIRTTQKQQNQENQNGKKNSCMDTSNDKLVRLHMRRPINGYEMETSREKVNLF